MSGLHVLHWHNQYRLVAALPAGRIEAWNAALADMDLDSELEALAGDDWLCIRKLDFKLSLRAKDGPVQAGLAWRDALLASLRDYIGQASSNKLVRYRHKRDALADMLYRAAASDLRRAWAWRQLGLLPAGTTYARTVLESAIKALIAEPEMIWPVFMRLLIAEPETGAWTALMRGLAEKDCAALLEACPQTQFFWRVSSQPFAEADAQAIDLSGPAALLLAWIATHPWQAYSQCPALKVLLAGLMQPASASCLAQAQVWRILSSSSELVERYCPSKSRPTDRTFTGQALRQTPRHPGQPGPAKQNPAEFENQAFTAQEESFSEDLPEAPSLPESLETEATDWAGLLYLVHLLPETGFLEQVQALDDLRPLLSRIAHCLHVPASDPAVRAFAGDTQVWTGLLTDERESLAQATALGLCELLAARLEDSFQAQGIELVEEVCRRPGLIRFEPGWIEISLPLDCVDVGIRRAGLDLDPGWMPWLGVVLRFVYE